MCVKCKKRDTLHASKKCGMCCSNDSSVQESATVTAMARPLNFSIMAAISMVSSQPSRTCSQPGRPSVVKIIPSVVAQLPAFKLVSATQCGAVVRCVTSTYPGKSNDGMVPQDISCETVLQSIVEGGIVCDLKWEEDKASGTIPDWLGPVTDLPPLLIEKGCEDHFQGLRQGAIKAQVM